MSPKPSPNSSPKSSDDLSADFEYHLPPELQQQVKAVVKTWHDHGSVKQLWKKDATLWTGRDEDESLGWLDIVERQQNNLDRFRILREEMQLAAFEAVILLGTGGAIRPAELLAGLFGQQSGFLTLRVLDSTHPAQVQTLRDSLNLERTLFLVASKSGQTLETNLLMAMFLDDAKKQLGDQAGRHFIAITDPGSKLESIAREEKFRAIYTGDPSINGRYSIFSDYGLIPAAILGIDVERLLNEAKNAVQACRLQEIPKNPGALLGLVLGCAQQNKTDKVTFFLSPEIRSLGPWLEQLLAGSTGKEDHGILPVIDEHIAPPSHYGPDRLFVYLHLEGTKNKELAHQVERLELAGHPTIRITIASLAAVPRQLFVWQIATAVACSVLGVQPFNQPDVEAAKAETRLLTDEYSRFTKPRLREPIYAEGGEHGMLLYANKKYATKLKKLAGDKPTVESLLRAHLNQLNPGDYFAALAYLPQLDEHYETIQFFRHQLRGAKKVATSFGFGPRFQHATGQLYKGGPNTGVFLQITAAHAADLAIPGQPCTFGAILDAQAAGDLAVLEQRGRRVLRVHLGADINAGLKRLSELIESALNGD